MIKTVTIPFGAMSKIEAEFQRISESGLVPLVGFYVPTLDGPGVIVAVCTDMAEDKPAETESEPDADGNGHELPTPEVLPSTEPKA